MSPPAAINLISASLSPRMAANHTFDAIIEAGFMFECKQPEMTGTALQRKVEV